MKTASDIGTADDGPCSTYSPLFIVFSGKQSNQQ